MTGHNWRKVLSWRQIVDASAIKEYIDGVVEDMKEDDISDMPRAGFMSYINICLVETSEMDEEFAEVWMNNRTVIDNYIIQLADENNLS